MRRQSAMRRGGAPAAREPHLHGRRRSRRGAVGGAGKRVSVRSVRARTRGRARGGKQACPARRGREWQSARSRRRRGQAKRMPARCGWHHPQCRGAACPAMWAMARATLLRGGACGPVVRCWRARELTTSCCGLTIKVSTSHTLIDKAAARHPPAPVPAVASVVGSSTGKLVPNRSLRSRLPRSLPPTEATTDSPCEDPRAERSVRISSPLGVISCCTPAPPRSRSAGELAATSPIAHSASIVAPNPASRDLTCP